MRDNTVIPSYLEVAPREPLQDNGFQTNLSLRYGEVKELLLPSNPKNQNKRFIEYYVDVTGKDGFGARTTIRYQTCQLVNLFGTTGDLCRYTLRQGDAGRVSVGLGAKVLMLCIDGEQSRAIIIGGVRDATVDSAENVDTDLGHNYFWEFNGIQQTVDKDGQLQFMFHGATDELGQLADGVSADAEGSTILMDKTGGIKLGTPDDDQSLYLDHDGKKYQVSVNDWDATVGGLLKFDITGKADITTKQVMTLTATSNIILASSGVLIGAATDATLKGSSFRRSQAQMNQSLKTQTAAASAALNAAAAGLAASAPGLTTPAAKAAMAMAAQAVSRAATALNAMASAIAGFEGNASQYLSSVNLSD